MKDQVKPEGKWTFGDDVAACFDDMLARSIPDYRVMRHACLEVGSRFVQPATDVVDIGCSRGEALASFVGRFNSNRFVGVEVSDPMATAAETRFRQEIDAGRVQIYREDLRTFYPMVAASLTLSVLTLQFVPIDYRQQIVSNAFKTTVPGGAFLVVEKVLGSDDRTNTLMRELYHEIKAENGYSHADIERKRFSLEGVLVPVTAEWNEQLLRRAGFSSVDVFWRYLNFCAWVAIK